MTALPAATDFTGSTVTEGQFKTAITDQRAFLAGLVGTDGAIPTALAALGALGAGYLAKSAAYTVVAGDRGKLVDADGTWTLSLTSASTLGAGFAFAVRNSGAGTITIDPSGAQEIDDATTLALAAGQSCVVVSTGSEWRTVGRQIAPASPGRLLRITRYKTAGSGTWTKLSDVGAIFVRVVGAGGGAGMGSASNDGLGGGAGGYSQDYITSVAGSYSYTVGAGGAAATVADTAGSAGGNSAFGPMTANGGDGGGFGTGGLGGNGGSASGGDINVRGGPGILHAGGNSAFGGGGQKNTVGDRGGGGGGNTGSGTTKAGGPGYVEVWEYAA